MDTEEHRIVDLIVRFERHRDASRFSVERERAFGRRERVAGGYIELSAPDSVPRFVFDRPGTRLSTELEHWLRLRWITMQRSLRAEQQSLAP